MSVRKGLVHPIQPGDGDPRHGTPVGYTDHGCRCDLCRGGIVAFYREKADRIEGKMDRPPSAVEGHLESLCWCETETVWVSTRVLRDGRTDSCGRAGCERTLIP